jgi:hypothetical protein
MISSRCNDPIAGATGQVLLSEVRRNVKEEIEATLAQGRKLAFEVWISEDGDPGPASADAWDVCMAQARSCDILLCLYNGHSGWAAPGSSIGICQAELQTAVDAAPEKVRLIQLLPDRARSSEPEKHWDANFRTYVERLSLFRGGEVARDADSARHAALAAIRSAVVELTRSGARASRMRSAYQGEALDWNRLDFTSRKQRMQSAMVDELVDHPGAERAGGDSVILLVANEPVLFVCHAIPAPMTIAQAREMVGQPFLHDHTYLDANGSSGGPVHLIACYGNVTDGQARRQLGFPDATVVSPPFGVWVADPVQKIQMLFLGGCVDSTSTRGQIERAFDWLRRAGEDSQLASRAAARARIVHTITAELATPAVRDKRGPAKTARSTRSTSAGQLTAPRRAANTRARSTK